MRSNPLVELGHNPHGALTDRKPFWKLLVSNQTGRLRRTRKVLKPLTECHQHWDVARSLARLLARSLARSLACLLAASRAVRVC